jgi:hypothetical protein
MGGFLREIVEQCLHQHPQAGEFLLCAVVQILANATLFVVDDAENVALKFLALPAN